MRSENNRGFLSIVIGKRDEKVCCFVVAGLQTMRLRCFTKEVQRGLFAFGVTFTRDAAPVAGSHA